MVLNKNKPTTREGKIFFINASKEHQQHPEVRKLNHLGDENIKKIVKAYKKFINEEGFSKIVEIEKIKENDYNLNVTLYVFPEEETEEIDLTKEWKELRKLEGELVEVEKRIEGYLLELQGEK
jgi:type I restriction enzyme M protein